MLSGERLEQRRSGGVILEFQGSAISVPLIIIWGGRERERDLDLDKVGRGDQAYMRAALDPHLAIRVETCAPRPASTPTKERTESVGVPVRIAGPVFDACVDDVELKGEDVLEDVRARGGRLDGRERAEQVRRFCRGLVEEAEAGEGGEPKGPELCEGEGKGRRCMSEMRRRGEEGRTSVQHEGHVLWIRLHDAVACHSR